MHDVATERATLGAVMLSDDVAADVFAKVQPTDFYDPRHQAIATVMAEQWGRTPLDMAALGRHLHASGDLARVGGGAYLAELYESAPSTGSAAWHAGQVAALARRRRLDEAVLRARHAVRDPGLDVETATDRVATLAATALDDDTATDCPVLFHDDIDDLIAAVESPDPTAGISTGLGSLDEITGRLIPGQLVVIAGRPGMGKSMVVSELARSAAWHQAESVMVCSLEMGRGEIQARMLSAEAGVPLRTLTRPPAGGADAATIARLRDTTARTRGSLLHLHTDHVDTVAAIRAQALRLHRTVGLGLIIVDYLQLLASTRPRDNRTAEITEISRDLKLLAMELDVPVIACAQLNRASEQRSDRRPQLSDLRESGSIEQDANVVVLLHRPDYYDEADRPGELDLIVAKNRNGATGTAVVAAQFHKSRVIDMGVPPETGH